MNARAADRLSHLEITSPGFDRQGRHIFHLVFHLGVPQVVWAGFDYGAAILAAEPYEFYGVEVIDRVGAS